MGALEYFSCLQAQIPIGAVFIRNARPCIFRPLSGFFLIVVLCIAFAPFVEATPAARTNFVIKWPTVRAAVREFAPMDAARFETRIEGRFKLSRSPIQDYPAPYVEIGGGGGESFFFGALATLLKQALARGEAMKVDAFMADFNRRHSAYLIRLARELSGCARRELALEVSGGARGPVQYVIVVWSRGQPPSWCRMQGAYMSHGGGYRALATGVSVKTGTAWRPRDDPHALRTWVADIQWALTRLRYRPGPADGVAGPKTRQAIQQFQNDRGLVADGLPTAEILKRLKAAVARKNGG